MSENTERESALESAADPNENAERKSVLEAPADSRGDWPERSPLELAPAEMRMLGEAAIERLVEHIESLPRQAAADTAGAEEVAAMLRDEALPERGVPLDQLLDLFFERVVPPSFNTAGPGYMAYIPGGGLFHAAIADLIAGGVNRYAGVYAAAPALAQLETTVLRWFARMLDLPRTTRGILTTGGSLANFSAIFTARRERLPPDFLNGTLYASDHTHHSVQKAALLAGFPPDRVRSISTDASYRIRVSALEAAIRADRRDGLMPFLLVGNAGTTPTGAVDRLDELAGIAARERLWFHVDAAYGGFFALTARGRRLLAGIAAADSVVLDPHKGLFLPYGTGALLVRDGEALRRAHAVPATYLPPMQVNDDRWDFSEMSPELSRPLRGLRVWLPLKMHGVGVFRDALDEKLDLALWAADRVRETESLELLAEPQLSLLAFAVRRKGAPAEQDDRLTRALLERINARQRVHLSGTTLDARFAIRICVLSFRTHHQRLRDAIEDVRAALAETLARAAT